jgi:plasmid maintenance system killer protein
LLKRRLLIQFSRKEEAILAWRLKQVDFKIRQPKSEGLYYFRINEQYRAIWRIENDIFYITEITNHQN